MSSAVDCVTYYWPLFYVPCKITLLIMETEAISWNFLGPDHYQIITGNYFSLVFERLFWSLDAHLNSFFVSVDLFEVMDVF